MRIVLIAVAGLGVILSTASSTATNANPQPVLVLPAQPANHNLVSHTPVRPRPFATPRGCDSNYKGANGYFVGIPLSIDRNHAGGLVSAVLGGTDNGACADYSAVLEGDDSLADGNYSIIGGGLYNVTTTAGQAAFIGDGTGNEAADTYAFVGAGIGNLSAGFASFVGAGGSAADNLYHVFEFGNSASGADSFVGAGDLNQISSTGNGSFIGGGGYEFASKATSLIPGNQISGVDSFIGAGDENSVRANEAFVGGGRRNTIGGEASFAVISGGHSNTAYDPYAAVGGGTGNFAGGGASVVGGGWSNSARGVYGTVPGGYENSADGTGSFAAGSQAKARDKGAFVWSDNASSTSLRSTASYQFIARASGGFSFYTNAAATSGAELAPNSGSWGSLSDRTMKSNVVPLDDAAVLDKVAALPVSEWSYTGERGVRHVGPMAQDFYAAFGVGEDNRHITSIDEDGVALAAIKALHAENARLRRDLESDNMRLRSRLAVLEAKLDRLASRGGR